MPSRINVKVIEARELPIMNSSSKKTDAYVEVIFHGYSEKTRVQESLNPVWNEEFVIEVTKDRDILKAPLEFKVWDHDTFGSDNVIGLVMLDLNGLIHKKECTIDGWFPIFDTFTGLQGQLHFQTSVDIFGIVVDSSLTVKFSHLTFSSDDLVDIFGFVDEILVSDELEQNKRDSFRSPRVYNEFRQALFYRLSSKLKHRIGTKVRHLGGDAVLGYLQHFDFEANGTTVLRGYGMAVKFGKESDYLHTSFIDTESEEQYDDVYKSPIDSPEVIDNYQQFFMQNEIKKHSNIRNKKFSIFQSNDKDVQFITLESLPECYSIRIGGVVSVRSLKVIPGTCRSEEKDSKLQKWWGEVRQEIRTHTLLLSCNFILGYRETCEIQDNLFILTAYGTAALIKFQFESKSCTSQNNQNLNFQQQDKCYYTSNDHSSGFCSFFHVPFRSVRTPFDINLTPCLMCGAKFVPEILLATIDPLPYLKSEPGQMIEAHTTKFIKKSEGEIKALLLTETIPFVEYDLYRQLINKLKLLGLNSVFKLKIQILIGEGCVMGFIQATGFRVLPLPVPQTFVVSASTMEKNSLWSRVVKYNLHNHKCIEQYFGGSTATCKESELSEGMLSTPSIGSYPVEIGSANTSSTVCNDALYSHRKRKGVSLLTDIDYRFDEEFLLILASERKIDQQPSLFNTEYYISNDDCEDSCDLSLTCLKIINFSSDNITTINGDVKSALSSIYSNIELKFAQCALCTIFGISTKFKILENNDLLVLFEGIARLAKKSSNTSHRLIFSNNPDTLISSNSYPNYCHSSFDQECYSRTFISSIHLFLIRECFTTRHENTSPSEFISLFLSEIKLIVRSHVSILGGNALTNFNMDFTYDSAKNHFYSIVNITGDVVIINKSTTS